MTGLLQRIQRKRLAAGFNDRAVTGGASISPRAGMFVDGHVVIGGEEGESGWGVASRVSF